MKRVDRYTSRLRPIHLRTPNALKPTRMPSLSIRDPLLLFLRLPEKRLRLGKRLLDQLFRYTVIRDVEEAGILCRSADPRREFLLHFQGPVDGA